MCSHCTAHNWTLFLLCLREFLEQNILLLLQKFVFLDCPRNCGHNLCPKDAFLLYLFFITRVFIRCVYALLVTFSIWTVFYENAAWAEYFSFLSQPRRVSLLLSRVFSFLMCYAFYALYSTHTEVSISSDAFAASRSFRSYLHGCDRIEPMSCEECESRAAWKVMLR